jgi:hypothetical protein
MNYQRWVVAAVAVASTTAAAEQAPAIRIGQPLKDVVSAAGAKNLLPGGPESETFRHYELSGPLAARLSGKQDGTAYLVFQVAPDRQTEKLVYASWKLGREHELALLHQFGIASNSQRRSGNTICANVSPTARLAVADASSDWSRQAVLEAVKTPKQVRPTFSDLCGPSNSGVAR